jgi:adenylate cyclase
MNTEIERKFLVVGDAWRADVSETYPCEQGYICSGPNGATVRVRRMGDRGFLTLKGRTSGISRTELEYEVPVDEAEYMLRNFCGDRVVSKTRYIIEDHGSRWEVDEFSGNNDGLIVAEIELNSEGQPFENPVWLGDEVSHESRYFNAALATYPFSQWK